MPEGFDRRDKARSRSPSRSRRLAVGNLTNQNLKAGSGRGSGLLIYLRLPRKHHLMETKIAHVLNAHRVEHAVQMIAFVLHHASVKVAHAPVDRQSVLIVAAIAQA